MVAACLRGCVGPHPFVGGSTASAGPRLKPAGVLPSGKEPVGEPGVEEGGESLPLGSMGVGPGLGVHPFGGNRSLGAKGWNLGPPPTPTLRNPMHFP